MNRRRTDQPYDLDGLRLVGWCWVAYLAFVALCAFVATPACRELLVFIWSHP